jgi:hypothetical protein
MNYGCSGRMLFIKQDVGKARYAFKARVRFVSEGRLSLRFPPVFSVSMTAG